MEKLITNGFIALFIIYLSITISVAQVQVKDFFLPAPGLNRASLYMPDPKTGKKTEFTSNKWFIQKEGGYDILTSRLFKGQIGSVTTETVIFTQNEVKLIRSISTSVLETEDEEVYEPARILIKLPSPNKKVTWTFKEHSGDKYTCTAELITLKISGKDKQTIKVTRNHYDKGKVTWASKVDYYVKGIGFYKSETLKGEILEKFEKQSFDPEVELMTDKQAIVKEATENKKDQFKPTKEPRSDMKLDKHPDYEGGMTELFKYIKENLVYPEVAKRNGLEGYVTLQFKINADGDIKDISIIKGLSKETDAEAIRLIRALPKKWTPGILNGKAIDTDYTLPIRFTLQ